MSDISLSDLALEIANAGKQELALRLATIESIQTGTVSVRVAGSTTVTSGVDYVGYAPKVGDIVLCFQNGNNLVIWGIPGSTGGIPTGSILTFGSATPPSGYLICNGQSTSGYPALAAVVGSTVPDLRDMFVVGAGLSYAVGGRGGAATVTLSEANMPSHNHAGFQHTHSTPSHVHTVSRTRYTTSTTHHHSGGPGGGGFLSEQADNSEGDTNPSPVTNNDGGGTTGADGSAYVTGVKGGGTAHENRPPYYALVYIIKT